MLVDLWVAAKTPVKKPEGEGAITLAITYITVLVGVSKFGHFNVRADC